MICRCQGASFVSSYPRVLSFSDCSFSFSSSSRFSFSCSFLLSSRGHRASRSPEPREPPCPPTQGRGVLHSPFLLPAKAKGTAELVEPREPPPGAASPDPGSPLFLQLLAQDVPPPGRHAGQARLLFLLLQQTAELPALPALTAGTVGPQHHPGARHHILLAAPSVARYRWGSPAHGSPTVPTSVPTFRRRREEEGARGVASPCSTPQLYCTTRGGPHCPGTANATPEGSAAPPLRLPHNTQPRQAAHTATSARGRAEQRPAFCQAQLRHEPQRPASAPGHQPTAVP